MHHFTAEELYNQVVAETHDQEMAKHDKFGFMHPTVMRIHFICNLNNLIKKIS